MLTLFSQYETGKIDGKGLLWAEAKLGELLSRDEHRGGKSDRSSKGGTSKPLPDGITKKESHEAQTLAKHPERPLILPILEGRGDGGLSSPIL